MSGTIGKMEILVLGALVHNIRYCGAFKFPLNSTCYQIMVLLIYIYILKIQPGSPPSRAYEAPTPGSGWTNTPSNNYNDAGTPRDSGSAYGDSILFSS